MKLGLIARAAGAAAVLLSSATAVQAAPVTYTLIGSDSGFGVTGTIAGEAIPFNGASMSTLNVTGQFTGDRNGNTITFSGGSTTVPNTGSYRPAPGGDPSNTKTALANFGFSTSSVLGAIRDLKFHLVSTGPATIDGAGHIPVDAFEIAIDSGTYAYVSNPNSAFPDANDVDFSSPRSSDFKFNSAVSKPTFSVVDGQEHLVLPFKFTAVTSTITSNDTELVFNGTLEAAGPAVPEPTGLFALAGAGVFLGGRRRR